MKRNILILYSSNDELWKDGLESQIDVLVKAGGHKITADFWSEKRCEPGDDWYPDLESAFNRADLIILMLSESFLASPVMQSEKVKERLREKRNGGFPIFLLLLYKCGWRRFTWLKALPVWPKEGSYLSNLSESAAESALADTTEEIAEKLKLQSKITEGILSFLALRGIGPARDLSFEPGRRLNIITGDNSFGKTLLMETAWWALAGTWPKSPILPRNGADKNEINISLQLTAKSGSRGEVETILYDEKKGEWPRSIESVNACGLVIYAGLDGSFTVWDPVRGKKKPPQDYDEPESPLHFKYTDMVFNGIKEEKGTRDRFLCNGLIADWVDWQKTAGSPFSVFEKILDKLSCSRQDPLIPVNPVRIPGDSRPMPSLRYPYGIVPIIHAAASVKRIVSLAYLIIHTWNEHRVACERHCETYKNMVVIIDELECHLHPQWQRTIVPSLLEVKNFLDHELDIQFLITTHSPLVLASLEPVFDKENDKIFHLELKTDEIVLKEEPFLPLGPADEWYTSEMFGLFQARSLEAEDAIRDAEQIQKKDQPGKEEVKEVHERLRRYLGDFDTYWPHWICFAEHVTGEKL